MFNNSFIINFFKKLGSYGNIIKFKLGFSNLIVISDPIYIKYILQENYNAEVIAYTANIGQEIDKKKILDNEILELAINGGAEDCLSNALYHEIITLKDNFYKVKLEIEKKVQEFISSGIEWVPLNKITLDKEKTKSVLNFLEALEDNDDVQYVFSYIEIYNNLAEKI